MARTPRIHTGTKAWSLIRQDILDRDSLTCKSCNRFGNEVDHIDGDPHNNDPSNLQTLCRSCHSRKTALENGGFGKVKAGPVPLQPAKIRGFDANGEPLDERSPFFAPRAVPTHT